MSNQMLTDNSHSSLRWWVAALLMLMLCVLAVTSPSAIAQDGEDNQAAGEFRDNDSPTPADSGAPATRMNKQAGINLLGLLFKGGYLMVPIVIMSFIVVAFAIERFLGLRRSKVIPEDLVTALGQIGGKGGFDPRKAYKLCQQYPSAAATVIRAMLLKVGRPHTEVESAVNEASEREADRMHANVRWLTMAAAVAPLLGLFGTVWGMIQAFHQLTVMDASQNKADELATGIYVALVTTLGGLAVAIPAAICAFYLEGRITTLFHQIDELLFNLMPQVERYEGRVRFGRNGEMPETEEKTEPAAKAKKKEVVGS